MSEQSEKILVTGATGKLGRFVVEGLLEKLPAENLAVAVRSPEKASAWAARGVEIRQANYDRPETVREALKGIDKVLLISANEVGKRAAQHKVVIDAAKSAGVKHLTYTSLLHADRAKMMLAGEHKQTEEMIRASGMPFTILRNGWYIENYTENLAPVLEHGALLGSAGDGKVAPAARKDFAEAAVQVLTTPGHENKVYELAGDQRLTLGELAAEVGTVAAKPIAYKDLSTEQHAAALAGAGVPAPFAKVLADSDAGIARGELDDTSGDLHRLIGRPTTPVRELITQAIQA